MREQDVRELLDAAAGGEAPPSAVDLDQAVRDGRRTRTTRRAFLAGGTVLGVSAVLGATAVLRPSDRRPDPTTTPAWGWPPRPYGPRGGPALPAIPERFDLFGQWAVFGWLPFTPATVTSSVEAGTFGLEAEGGQVFRLAMITDAAAADELTRKGTTEEAPPVAGCPARWISTRNIERESLQWQFAGGWAQLTTELASGEPGRPELRPTLHRVASEIGLSAARRQRFPFRTGAVPAGIPLTRVQVSLTAAGHWDVGVFGGPTYSFAISLTNVPAPMRTIEPSMQVGPTSPEPVGQTIGHEVDGLPGVHVRSGDSEFVRAFRPDGVMVTVSARFEALRQLGPGGVLGLYRTIEVLPDPTTWTDRPI